MSKKRPASKSPQLDTNCRDEKRKMPKQSKITPTHTITITEPTRAATKNRNVNDSLSDDMDDDIEEFAV